MQIQKNHVATFHFTLKNTDGDVIDSSQGQDPLSILVGHANIAPGVDQALMGKSAGDTFTATVEPEQGYGERNDQAVQNVPLTAFEEIEDLQVGMELMADTEQGPRPIKVLAIEDGEVTVDGNHPLAGQTLVFDIEITDVRDGLEEELEHGHAH